jgi:hypothetical protein
MEDMNANMAQTNLNVGAELGIKNQAEQSCIGEDDDKARMRELSLRLNEKGRQADIAQAEADTDYRQALYKEFGIC